MHRVGRSGPEEVTFAHLLGKAGYQCGRFGKWHVGPVKAASPTNPGAMGFHQWLSHDNFFELDPYLSRNGGPPEMIPGESSEILVRAAIQFINETRKRKKPFCTVIWFGSPHEPYSGLPADLALYDDLPRKYSSKKVRLTSNDTGGQTTRSLGEVLRELYAEITAMDRAIGILRKYLSEQELRTDTLLFYCGDNGTSADASLASPHRGVKGQVYEAGTLVPGLIEWPARFKQPGVTHTRATTSDLLPTVCALTGQPLPRRPLDGIDLMPLLDANEAERPVPLHFWEYNSSRITGSTPKAYLEPALQEGTTPLAKLAGGKATRDFWNFHHPGEIIEADFLGPRAIIDGRLKFVVHERRQSEPLRELFDLDSDPGEKVNLIDQQPETTLKLETKLRNWQRSVLDSLLGKDYAN